MCFARATNLKTVRAEGLTEDVGNVQLVCRDRDTASTDNPFAGDAVPHKLTIALELSSNITNEINDDRVVTPASTVTDTTAANYVKPYDDPGMNVTVREHNNGNFDSDLTPITGAFAGGGKLSSDGKTITWSIYTSADDPDTAETETRTIDPAWASSAGFTAVFSKVRVNAYKVGDGEDVMANILVGGRQVNSSPMKVGGRDDRTDDVGHGEIGRPVRGREYRQRPGDGQGRGRQLVPERRRLRGEFQRSSRKAWSIKVQSVIPVATDDTTTSAKEDEETFRLELEETNPRTSGVDKDDMVILSTAGTGSVRYNIEMTLGDHDNNDDTDDTLRDDLMDEGALEWQHITPTFTWKKNDVDLGMVMVSASYHPVSSNGGDTFKVGGAAVPRFMDASTAATIVTVKDCTSELFYPFVTSASGYDTGIVVSNTSDEAGTCSATYSGVGAPTDAVDLGEIMPGMQSVHLVSSHTEDFSGYLTVNCDTVSASGFAHVVDTSGLAGSQGYIAE